MTRTGSSTCGGHSWAFRAERTTLQRAHRIGVCTRDHGASWSPTPEGYRANRRSRIKNVCFSDKLLCVLPRRWNSKYKWKMVEWVPSRDRFASRRYRRGRLGVETSRRRIRDRSGYHGWWAWVAGPLRTFGTSIIVMNKVSVQKARAEAELVKRSPMTKSARLGVQGHGAPCMQKVRSTYWIFTQSVHFLRMTEVSFKLPDMNYGRWQRNMVDIKVSFCWSDVRSCHFRRLVQFFLPHNFVKKRTRVLPSFVDILPAFEFKCSRVDRCSHHQQLFFLCNSPTYSAHPTYTETYTYTCKIDRDGEECSRLCSFSK